MRHANDQIKQRFARVMGPYGESLNLVGEDAPQAAGLRELHAIFRYCVSVQTRAVGESGLVYFDYLDNSTFNAIAISDDTNDFVAVFLGLLTALYRISYCFFADPEVLPAFGDAKGERLMPAALASIRARENVVGQHQYPRDTKRYQAAQNMALTGCLLVLNHELGHVANCHPRFIRRHFGVNAHEELPIHPLSYEQAAVRRAFEWEADEYAAVCTYVFMHHFKSVLPEVDALGLDYVQAAASFHLFLYIHKLAGVPFDSESESHPAPLDRWIWVTERLESHDRTKVLSPSHESVLRAITDVSGFWMRHKLADNQLVRLPNRDALMRTQARHDEASAALQLVRSELSAIEAARNEGGRVWAEQHKDDIFQYAEEALNDLAASPRLDFRSL